MSRNQIQIKIRVPTKDEMITDKKPWNYQLLDRENISVEVNVFNRSFTQFLLFSLEMFCGGPNQEVECAAPVL